FSRALVAALTTSLVALPAFAQRAATAPASAVGAAEFTTGNIYARARVWLGNLNGAIAIGGQAEKGFTKAGQYGSGIISGGGGVDWYRWSHDFGTIGSYSYNVIPLQVFSNYHFAIEGNKKLDPYLG